MKTTTLLQPDQRVKHPFYGWGQVMFKAATNNLYYVKWDNDIVSAVFPENLVYEEVEEETDDDTP